MNEHSGRNSARNTLIVIACFAVIQAISAFYNDYRNSRDYPGVEQRARIVAARLLGLEHSSYFFTWTTGMPEQLLSPVGITTDVPPSVLAIDSLYGRITVIRS